MVINENLITADRFWQIAQQPENRDKRLELVEGVIVEIGADEVAGSGQINTVTAARIVTFLNMYVLPRQLGVVAGADGAFTLTNLDVRLPDAAFISKARHSELTDDPFPIAPDLAVEVASQNDKAWEIRKKVRLYLTSGTQLVWVVYPVDKTVDEHQRADDGTIRVQTFSIDDTLDGGDVLPGFSLPVKDIFPD